MVTPSSCASICEDQGMDYLALVKRGGGGRGQGHLLGQHRLGPARLAHCMRWIGQAEVALDMMVDRALERYSHGSVLAEKQGIQWLISDSAVELYQCKLMVLHAAYQIEQGQEHPPVQQELARPEEQGHQSEEEVGVDVHDRPHYGFKPHLQHRQPQWKVGHGFDEQPLSLSDRLQYAASPPISLLYQIEPALADLIDERTVIAVGAVGLRFEELVVVALAEFRESAQEPDGRDAGFVEVRRGALVGVQGEVDGVARQLVHHIHG